MVCLLLLAFSMLLTIGVNSEHQRTSATPYTITCDPGADAGCRDESLEQIAAGLLSQQPAVRINITIPQLELDTNITFLSSIPSASLVMNLI